MEADDVEPASGAKEVALQKEVLGWVKEKLGADEQKFAAFLRFTMAYGRSQCDAREFHGFLRVSSMPFLTSILILSTNQQDQFGMEGALFLVPKLARLIKEKLYRVNLLKYNAGLVELNKSRSTKRNSNIDTQSDADTAALVDQVGKATNLTAFTVPELPKTAAEPPPPPIS
jgi:hypothetical protein